MSIAVTSSDRQEPSTIPIVGLGASAGDIETLEAFFEAVPDNLGFSYVVALCPAPDREGDLPRALMRRTSMRVRQIGDAEEARLEANHVYVVAPECQLELKENSVVVSPFEPSGEQRSAIDVFFRSLASRGDGVAVLLSGRGSDGALGERAIQESGCLVLVQDPREAAHAGMPGTTDSAAVADIVLPVRELAACLAGLAQRKRRISSPDEPVRAWVPASPPRWPRPLATVTWPPRDEEDFGARAGEAILRRGSRASSRGAAPPNALVNERGHLHVEVEVVRRFHEMTLKIITSETLDEALREILAAAIDLHGADCGTVHLADEHGRELRLAAHSGSEPKNERVLVTANDSDACSRVLRTHEACWVQDVRMDEADDVGAAEARSHAIQCCPLFGKEGTLVGVTSTCFREARASTQRDKHVRDLIACYAGVLIESRRQQELMTSLNTELRQRTTELAERDRNKESFLALLGHELRNSLGAIENSLDFIAPGDQRSTRSLAVVRRQSRHIVRLVSDLLDITRINRGKLELRKERVDLNQCVRDSVDALRSQIGTKGLALEIEVPESPIYVDADPERLAQILDNLLQNALRYTDEGAIVVSAREDDGHARVTVRDTGVGIDSESVSRVFDAYHQASRGQRRGGLGLGLTLAKTMVEMHGGTISVQSNGLGAGSEFLFNIPLASSVPEVSWQSLRSELRSHRILVVDDHPDSADAFAAVLESLGQRAATAYDGERALEICREQCPEIVFLDLSMPMMDGSQLAQRLRRHFAPDVLTLIALTGLAKAHTGFDDSEFAHYLLKPATTEQVVRLLRSISRRGDV